MAKRAPFVLAAVLGLALALRVWGLTWGLPTATHYYSYHPDESVVLGAAMSMNVFGGQILPHFYNYGSLQLYLVNIAATIAAAYGGGSLVIKDLAHDWPQWAHFYLAGRVLTVLMGVGTVWGVYALGKEMWGRRAGLLGAAFLSVMPLHAQHSHFLTVDVPAAFWGTWTLFWAAKIAPPTPSYVGDTLKEPLLAGMFAGLAVATKYNMALLILPIVLAILRAQGTAQQKARALIVTVFALGAAFLLACPGALLENNTFLSNVRFEAVHVQNADDPTFRDTGNGFLYQITTNLAAGIGWPLLLVTLFCIIYASYKRTKGDALLVAFALPYYILISLVAVRYARYTIPLLPVLALWTGRMLADGSRAPRLILRPIALTGTAALILTTLVNTIHLLRPMTQIDPRDAALVWLNANVPSPTPVAFAAQPWFGTAPVSPYFSNPRPGAWQKLTPGVMRQRILYDDKDWDIETLERQKPQFVILSEYDYRDLSRLLDPAWTAYMTTLEQGYAQAAVFPSPAPPASDGNDYDLPIHDLPHDMLYSDPAVVIFRRRP